MTHPTWLLMPWKEHTVQSLADITLTHCDLGDGWTVRVVDTAGRQYGQCHPVDRIIEVDGPQMLAAEAPFTIATVLHEANHARTGIGDHGQAFTDTLQLFQAPSRLAAVFADVVAYAETQRRETMD